MSVDNQIKKCERLYLTSLDVKSTLYFKTNNSGVCFTCGAIRDCVISEMDELRTIHERHIICSRISATKLHRNKCRVFCVCVCVGCALAC
jgi:hypothetical protein